MPARQMLTHSATSPACVMLPFYRSKASVDCCCSLCLSLLSPPNYHLFVLGFTWGIVFLEKPSLTLQIPLIVSFVFSELPEFASQSIPHIPWPSSVCLREFLSGYLLIQLQILAPGTKLGLLGFYWVNELINEQWPQKKGCWLIVFISPYRCTCLLLATVTC